MLLPADEQIGLNMTWSKMPKDSFLRQAHIYHLFKKRVIVLVRTDMNIDVVTYGKVNMDMRYYT